MPVVLKIDGATVDPLDFGLLHVETKIRKDDPDVLPGDAAFVWSHYSQPRTPNGQLLAVGVVTRSDDRKSIQLSVALSNCPPLRNWCTVDLDRLKNRRDGSPETEIADEVRGYTLDHVGHVSADAAQMMAGYFI